MLHKSVVGSVMKTSSCGDRIIALQFKEEPVNILSVRVCMRTSDHDDDDEVEEI